MVNIDYSMDNLPVEVVGNILSCLAAANDVVRASCTCWKWRNAFRYYLRSLKFHFDDSPAYFAPESEIWTFITTTIFQTNGLQELSIIMDAENLSYFPTSTVTDWLVYVRESLKSLHTSVKANPDINILDIYGRQKLKKLVVFHNSIMSVEPKYHLLPCLTTLSLNLLSISSVNFKLLLTACPKIETLSLFEVDIVPPDANGQVTLELGSSSLKAIYVEDLALDEFILKADSLEKLHFNDCLIEQFNFIGKGSLKHFELECYDLRDGGSNIDLGEVNLEIVKVNHCEFSWLKFYKMISRSSNLRVLRLGHGFINEVVYLEAIAKSFPYLTNFSFICDVRGNWLHSLHFIEGSSQLQNLVVLEVGWTAIYDQFFPFMESFLEKCPNLKKLNIHGKVSNAKTPEEYQILADLTSSMIQLMCKYMHVDVHFKYK